MCDESSTMNSGIMSGGIDASSSKNNYGKYRYIIIITGDANFEFHVHRDVTLQNIQLAP